jgi:hypothetical protein
VPLLLAGVVAGIAPVTAAAAARPGSQDPTAASAVTGQLLGVAAVSAKSAWAVGSSGAKGLILRWNGSVWKPVPSPSPAGSVFNGVAAASAKSAWAVGYYDPSFNNGLTGKTLIEHWNGTAWKRVPSPTPASGAVLTGVAATSASSAWAVGYTGRSASPKILIMHWNGKTWSRVSNPAPISGTLNAVTAMAKSGWAVGSAIPGRGGGKTLILRWNGIVWKRVPSPSPGGDAALNGVAAASAGSGWAVGVEGNGLGSMNTLILRWNGKVWKRAPGPNGAGPLNGVAATSARNAWTVGCSACDSGFDAAWIERWNGIGWKQVPNPVPGEGHIIYGVAAVSASNAWAVGINGPTGKTLILHWNGRAWKLS